jgi:hypothetical protein
MNPESKNLTAEQSLDIITKMIHEAKDKVQRNSFYFLFWGWLIALANLGVFVLTKLEFEYPFVVWTITIPAWIFSFVRGMRQGKAEGKSSHFNKISAALWLSFGVVVFTLVAFGYKINYELNPIILLISAIPTFASGVILRFKPLILGGILFWLFSIASFLIARDLQPLLGSIAIVFCYLIPGYILKGKKD